MYTTKSRHVHVVATARYVCKAIQISFFICRIRSSDAVLGSLMMGMSSYYVLLVSNLRLMRVIMT